MQHPSEVYLMPLILSSTQDWNHRDPDPGKSPYKQSLHGIALSPVEVQEEHRVFKRIGSFRIFRQKPRFQAIRCFDDLPDQQITII
jgi:hypothetical protein